jgi:hypothetical protein
MLQLFVSEIARIDSRFFPFVSKFCHFITGMTKKSNRIKHETNIIQTSLTLICINDFIFF